MASGSNRRCPRRVSTRLPQKYAVPAELALLYDFVNTLDCRRYVERGVAHMGGDEFETPGQMEAWMRRRRLLPPGKRVDGHDYRRALELRDALRSHLQLSPDDRRQDSDAARRLTTASRNFPLTLVVADEGSVALQAAPGSSLLGHGGSVWPGQDGSTRALEDLCVGRVPLDFLRSFQACQSALVFV